MKKWIFHTFFKRELRGYLRKAMLESSKTEHSAYLLETYNGDVIRLDSRLTLWDIGKKKRVFECEIAHVIEWCRLHSALYSEINPSGTHHMVR